MLKVKLLQYTPEPEKTIAAAAKLCYSPVGVDDILENLTDEGAEKFLNMLEYYGQSPIIVRSSAPSPYCLLSGD